MIGEENVVRARPGGRAEDVAHGDEAGAVRGGPGGRAEDVAQGEDKEAVGDADPSAYSNLSANAGWQHPLWRSLLPIGRSEETGGYHRYSFTAVADSCRAWFFEAARERGLRAETDRNGNLWAWWEPSAGSRGGPDLFVSGGVADAGGVTDSADGVRTAGAPDVAGAAGAASVVGEARTVGTPDVSGVASVADVAGPAGAIVTGSHLDSVPDGGAFDGPLGVVSSFAAVDLLVRRRLAPVRPLAVVAFLEEEGARFGVACLGSRLMTGVLAREAATALTDADGVGLGDAMAGAGLDPAAIGSDTRRTAGIAAYVELHIEQGRALADLGAGLGVAESIWPHARWRIEFAGRADHAGTTRLADRHDPMLPYAATVLAARDAAFALGALATIGKVVAEPGGSNAISSLVRCWLDVRAPDGAALEVLTRRILAAARDSAERHGVEVTSRRESFTPIVEFDAALRDRVRAVLARRGITAPVVPTGAGHDAGILAARLPTAMLFVRNPTGVSHSPREHADAADCDAGVEALAAVLEDLVCR